MLENLVRVQEIYDWLLGHWAVRSLMFQATQQQDLSPLRLGFTGYRQPRTLTDTARAIGDTCGIFGVSSHVSRIETRSQTQTASPA